MLVEGRVGDDTVGCLVDTGATVNILASSWWKRHGCREDLLQSDKEVYSVDGRPMQLQGRLCTVIELGGRSWPVEFEVADIATEAILGSTFLKEHRFLVDVAGACLWWDPEEDGVPPPDTCRLVSCCTAVIWPGEESILDGYLVGEWPGAGEGLVEGLRKMEEKRGVLVGRGLVDPREEVSPIRVFNLGQEAVVIYQDMALATIEPVVSPEEEAERGGGTPEEEGSDHCRMVGATDAEEDRVIEELAGGVEGERKEALMQLLWQHRGMFQMTSG